MLGLREEDCELKGCIITIKGLYNNTKIINQLPEQLQGKLQGQFLGQLQGQL